MRTRLTASRRGASAGDVIIVIVIVGVVALCVLMSLPRQREVARSAGCQRNLKQIGIALAFYDQAAGRLPAVAGPTTRDAARGVSPHFAFLEALGLPDFTELTDARKPPPRRAGFAVTERPVSGFVCASDPNAGASRFPAPVSYRATTGDAPDGRNGAFAPGRSVRLAEIEAADGLSYTAAFAERLLGDGNAGFPDPGNYALVTGPLGPGGCPDAPAPSWHGDAGSSWVAARWRSTLYNHALPPNASPSCVADDGRSAIIGASSSHVEGVNVLSCDGGVRTVTPRVDPKIWREWAAFPSGATTE